MFKKLAVLMELVSGFWFDNLNWQVVSVIERKSRIIPSLGVINYREIVSHVELFVCYSISVEIKLEYLTFLKTEHCTTGIS